MDTRVLAQRGRRSAAQRSLELLNAAISQAVRSTYRALTALRGISPVNEEELQWNIGFLAQSEEGLLSQLEFCSQVIATVYKVKDVKNEDWFGGIEVLKHLLLSTARALKLDSSFFECLLSPTELGEVEKIVELSDVQGHDDMFLLENLQEGFEAASLRILQRNLEGKWNLIYSENLPVINQQDNHLRR